ncbi:MAG TPA: hypothetical protein VGK49_02995 [Ilumatobacteraceae bacterium]
MLVICPSRGRPGNIAELLERWEDTGSAARLVVCVDDDDPHLHEYRRLGVRLVVGKRASLGGWLNRMVGEAEHHRIVGFIGDDVRPRTDRWDARIGEAMPEFGVVYGDDGHQHERMPTHPFIDARIIRRLGFIAPPGVEHLYLDDFWRAVGNHLGTLTYLADVELEHMHPHAGKAEMDDGYREVNSAAAYRHGRAAFERYMSSGFAADMAALA